jgi:hypothetical protein
MKRPTLCGGITGAAVLAALTWTTTSLADDATVVAPETNQAVVAETTTTAPPNVPVITTGLIALGGAYIPSVIVAAANDNPYDHKLFIPVVGPWMDLAQRPGGCGVPGFISCGSETGYKTLLILSGAFQGLGALGTVLGFVTPQHRTTVVTAKADAKERDKAHVQFFPTTVGRDAYGLGAVGTF